jgi:hypothetical protein
MRVVRCSMLMGTRMFRHGLIVLTTMLVLAVCLTPSVAPCEVSGFSNGAYILPPGIQERNLSFAEVRIPIGRPDVAARVLEQLNYLLMDHRAVILEAMDRMAAYNGLMTKILQDEKCPADLIYLAALIGHFDPMTKNKSGGIGWWGLGPLKEKSGSNHAQWVSDSNWDDRRDPVISTKIACGVLQNLHRRNAANDWLLTICAYLDGADKLDAITHKSQGFGYWDIVVPTYSEAFIPKLIALKIIDTHKDFYGLSASQQGPFQYDCLDRLKLAKDLPLHFVAKWCGAVPRNIWELNPAVDPASGVLAMNEKKTAAGTFLRVPKGWGQKVREHLVREKYVAE